jgi:dTDP-L-rhamnose 4-epimerase
VSPTGSQNVLVTGGAGFIGSALAGRVAHRFGRWVAFDILHPQVHVDRERPASLPAAVELVVGDVTSDDDWDALLADFTPDVIVHLAAETGTSQSFYEATRHALVNTVGTTVMMDALGRAKVRPRRVVLASSRAVYGEGTWVTESGERFVPGPRSHAQLERGEWDVPGARPTLSEAGVSLPRPVNVYGATKLAQEGLLDSWCGSSGVPLTALRLQNVYGPGQSLINAYTGIVSLFSQLAEAGESIPLYEDGRVVRDFVYIDDVVSALVAALDESAPTGTFDVGSGVASTLAELAQAIADYHGAPAPTVTGRYRDGDVRYAAASIEATRGALGWNPEVGMRDGVARLQAWIAAQDLRIDRR